MPRRREADQAVVPRAAAARSLRRSAYSPRISRNTSFGANRAYHSSTGGQPALTQRMLSPGRPPILVRAMTTTEKPIRLGRDRPTTPRLLRELETIEAMTRIYCADHHGTAQPCADCQALMTYASKRLAVCVFGEEKPVCAKCQVHCYGKVMREKVREVMRYAGPRMIWRHPWLALMHVVDKRYVAPPKPSAAARAAPRAKVDGAPAATTSEPDKAPLDGRRQPEATTPGHG
jgi:hypothetical protein